MCGIAGILNFNISPREEEIVKAMTDRLLHRGPDGEGYYHDREIALGHRRLAIIDLEGGSQPIFNEDKTIVVIYNGEIYNFHEIKHDLLARGHVFRTATDTEVIIHAYESFGHRCVSLFNGMFAFAIWDKRTKTLLLARDRLGIKPLYYYDSGTWLAFASEIKALFEHPGIRPQLNPASLADFLTFQNILDEKTIFQNVKKLLPANILTWSQGGQVRTQTYWEPDFRKTSPMGMDECLQRYREVFSQSVKRHLLSDVPVGSYLSGGFDSGAVALAASRFLDYPLTTFTGAFEEGDKYDERPCARAVAKEINARGMEVVIKPEDFPSSVEKIVYHMEEPYLGMGSFPQFHVSALVSRHVKVVLTGHGGDELFFGYPSYQALYLRQLISRNPFALKRAARVLGQGNLPRLLYFSLYPLINPDLKQGLYIMFSRREQRKLLGADFQKSLEGYSAAETLQGLPGQTAEDPLDRLLYLYLRTYLPALFILEDKLGMAHSIEARTPICDNRMVDLAVSLPVEFKLHKMELKAIPKLAWKGALPELLYRQPKRGFPTPLHLWFRKELKDFVYDTLLDPSWKAEGIINSIWMEDYLNSFCRRGRDDLFAYNHGSRIYSLLCLALWHKIFIRSGYGRAGKFRPS